MYLVIYNRNAGKKLLQATSLEAIKEALAKVGIAEHKLRFQALNRSLERHVAAAAKDGVSVVVAAGGDGTVSAVAPLALAHGLTLAVLPAGTLNHFAKDLQVGDTLEAAARTLRRGQTRSIDVASLNGRVFVNNSSLGLYAELVRRREQLQPLLTKWPAMVVAFVMVLSNLRRHRLRLHLDGQPKEVKASFVFIGNNAYRIRQGEFTARSRLDGGTLSVYVLKTARPLRLLRVAWRGLTGYVADDRAFDVYTANTLTVALRRRRALVARDGEVEQATAPLRYEIKPKALKVIAGR